ncbi:hypothetical protein BU17DRAFT_92394 [Hysterangium stoloniferum]|nr:hypothetical protein BU17DRAFT_92394 [Hysterangium stoloniferum]
MFISDEFWKLRHSGRSLLRKRRILLYLLLCVLLFPFLFNGISRIYQWAQYDPLWSHKHLNISSVVFPPQDPTYVVLEPPIPTESVPTIDNVPRLSADCIDAYFAHGQPCLPTYPDPPLDVVWTWVNGSDRLFMESLGRISGSINLKRPPGHRFNNRLYRNHDELRHSIRSVLKHFRHSTSRLHIITSDFHVPIPVMDGETVVDARRRFGLVPSWLDIRHTSISYDRNVQLKISFHSEIFKANNSPSFNSYAIESQFINMPDVSDHFVYLNDDMFMMADLSASDFYTSTYGVVLRMQADLVVEERQNPPSSNPWAMADEWGPLQYTNWCLGRRFGSRPRPYIAHTAKTISVPLMKEFSVIWATELAITASHPFRGMLEGNTDIYSLFLFSHSIVERWREALLWSWVVAKIGGMSDEWSTKERAQAWREVGGIVGQAKVEIFSEHRDTLKEESVHEYLQAAGHNVSGKTEYVFASGDGYPYAFRDETRNKPMWPSFGHKKICSIEYRTCFDKPDINTASELFKHIAFSEVKCGDCIIHALRSASGISGLAAFLPDPTRVFGTVHSSSGTFRDPPHLPLVSDWRQGEFSLRHVLTQRDVNIRMWTLRMLERYRFVIGETHTRFEIMSSYQATLNQLAKIQNDSDVALLCVNDNIVQGLNTVDLALRSWQAKRWSEKAAWER